MSAKPSTDPEPAAGLPATEVGESSRHDCWKWIGVEGNATCRELLKFTHCRNCPVYAAAGLQLLERPLPAEYRRETTAFYAQEKKAVPPTRLSVILFRLRNEWLALPTSAFLEIAERRPIHTLPHRRRSLALGLVNIRGELLVCASAARLIGLETHAAAPAETTPPSRPISQTDPLTTDRRQQPLALVPPPAAPNPQPANYTLKPYFRLLVTNWQGHRLALPVDEVFGIQRFASTDLQPVPATIAKAAQTYTRGVLAWRDRTVGLLDPESFFTALNRQLA